MKWLDNKNFTNANCNFSNFILLKILSKMVSNLSNEDYIDKKLRTIYEQMVRAAMNERPPELVLSLLWD